MKNNEAEFNIYEVFNGYKIDISFNYGSYTDSFGKQIKNIAERTIILKTKNKIMRLKKQRNILKNIFNTE